jgi:IMP cyclohydrolase
MVDEVSGLENLAKMDYPGRFIIIGATGEPDGPINVVVAYGITGRSKPSQARKFVFEGSSDADGWSDVSVVPTDEEVYKTGNPELLIYPAMSFSEQGIGVSNGKQTHDVHNYVGSAKLFDRPFDIILGYALAKWQFEPDEPNFTPRISGFINPEGEAALSILKRAKDGSCVRHYFTVPLIPGTGKLISTYTGENLNPLPSFRGEPLDLKISGATQKDIAEEIWRALRPDYSVSVACMSTNLYDLVNAKPSIINRHD